MPAFPCIVLGADPRGYPGPGTLRHDSSNEYLGESGVTPQPRGFVMPGCPDRGNRTILFLFVVCLGLFAACDCGKDANTGEPNNSLLCKCGVSQDITSIDDTGTINVSTETTGQDLDPDRYALHVGNITKPIDVNDFLRVTVGSGTHLVRLSDVRENCTVQQPTEVSITTTAQSIENHTFTITCRAYVGGINVFVTVMGTLDDPDGLMVELDDGGPQPIDVGGTTFADFALGEHVVRLTSVPAECVVVGDNPQSVIVEFGSTAQALFEVDCSQQNGFLEIVTQTTGQDIDPNGYLVDVSGEIRGADSNGRFTWPPLPVGDYTVELEDVADNCTVQSENPQAKTLEPNVTTEAVFQVTCEAATGSVGVLTRTTGNLPDPDGYTVQVGSDQHDIGINASETYSGIPPGDVIVTLGGLAANCVVTSQNPQTVAVEANLTAAVIFDVGCPAAVPPMLFESNRDGDFDLYAANGDGSGLIQLTTDPGADADPSWSWDNSRIIFRSTRGGQGDIWVMNADGSNPVQVTDNAADNEDPAFSPNGAKIAYEEADPDDGTLEIFIAEADGSSPVQLTDAAGISEAPHFHPDGTEILFKSDRSGRFDIYLMNVDGSNLRRLTNSGVDDFDPSWSPDGTQIVFSSQRVQPDREDIWIMDRNGDNETRLLFNNVWDWHPVFSTDGSQIIFTSDRDGSYDLFRMNPNGTGVVKLQNNSGQRDDDAEFKKPGN